MLDKEEFQKCNIPITYTTSPKPDLVHIGLVLLSTDHSLEMDWAKLYNTQAAAFTTRIYYSSELSQKDLDKTAKGIVDATNLIATGLDMDVMAFGCTSASIVIGEEKVAQLLTTGRGNIPATNPWTAAQAAFNFLEARKIAVFSPYPDAVNTMLYEQLIQAGFDVVALASLGIQRDTEITKISYASMIDGIEKILEKSKPDLIFMSCTNLRVLEHIQQLEDLFGIPIVSSNSAMFWHCMHLVGKKAKCPGFGKLLNS